MAILNFGANAAAYASRRTKTGLRAKGSGITSVAAPSLPARVRRAEPKPERFRIVLDRLPGEERIAAPPTRIGPFDVEFGESHRLQRIPVRAQFSAGPRCSVQLARISHELSAAAPDPSARAALRLFGLLDVLSSTPPSPSRHAPGMALWAMQEECSAGAGIYSRATRWPGGFATKTREKCGQEEKPSSYMLDWATEEWPSG